MNYKQERLGAIGSAVLKGFHIGTHKGARHIGISNCILAIAILTGHGLICPDKISIGIVRMEGHTLVLATTSKQGILFTV